MIRLDVSVLDKNRKPIHGLSINDFTVLEDGKPQRIVAVSEVMTSLSDLKTRAWIRFAGRDVATNDRADDVGSGRLFAFFMNDKFIPLRTPTGAMRGLDDGLTTTARQVGRSVDDHLAAADVAAVVFAVHAGNSQDFTADHGKLLEAHLSAR